MQKNSTQTISSLWSNTAVRQAIIIFIILRLFLTIWSSVAITINPPPQDAPDIVKQHLEQPFLDEGWQKYLLGPAQRFDSLRYTRIAAQGYAHVPDSVFPPLYPLGMGLIGRILGGTHASYLLAGLIISNLAFIGLLILLYRVAEEELGLPFAQRTTLYLAIFPTSFFLLTAYSESFFLLLALAALWLGRNGRFRWAGVFGFCASLTRLTGWVLVAPLAYEFWEQHLRHNRELLNPLRWSRTLWIDAFAVLLPGIGTFSFMVYRYFNKFPPLNQLYVEFWAQDTSIPGIDIWRAIAAIFLGQGPRAGDPAMLLDFGILILLVITTVLAFRYLAPSWGVYALVMLLFILLPTSYIKPLYSFSRYALAFFPLFFMLSVAGQKPWLNRLILYPSILLLLYFSLVFFMWGWVA